MKHTKIAIFCLLAFIGSTLLSACGNKGPLYTTTQEDTEKEEKKEP